MVIWKFPLTLASMQSVDMPQGATILHVGLQGATLCLWAKVNPGAPVVSRNVLVAGTGFKLPHDEACMSYVGTVQQGAFVWHVFDAGE